MQPIVRRLTVMVVLFVAAFAPASAFGADYLYYSGLGNGGIVGRVGVDGTGNNQNFAAPGTGVGYIAANSSHLIYVEAGSPAYIGRATIDGTSVDQHWLSQGSANNGPAIAITSRYIYYVTTSSGTSSIGRANIDGTGANAAFALPGTAVTGLAANEEYVYWTHSAGIGRMALDGSGLTSSFITTPNGAGIAVTPTSIYWTTSTGTVGRAALDGTGADPNFITGAGSTLRGIAVSGSKIFWVISSGSIASANIDGTGVNTSFVTGLPANMYGVTTQYTGAPATYALTVAKSGTGSGAVTSSPAGIDCGATCTATYTSGTSVTLTAAAAAGSVFSGWSGGCTGTAKTCTVSVTAATAVTATFVPAAASSAAPFKVNGKLRTRVTVTGAGTVTIVGRHVRMSHASRKAAAACTATHVFKKAASAWVVCTPSAATQALRASGPVAIALTMTFTPTGGKATTTKVGSVVLPRLTTKPSVVTG